MSNVNIKQVAVILGGRFGLTNATAEALLKEAFANIAEHVSLGDEVSVPGFGKFKKKVSAERIGRNPKTGEALTIAASETIGFKASSLQKK